MSSAPMSFEAIVLCGGAGRRLDGADKAMVMVGGRTLLERALDAVGAAEKIVAVGPERTVPAGVMWTRENPRGGVVWTREEPPGGGPVSGIAAGLVVTTRSVVVVLGVDFPFVDRSCVLKLLDALEDRDGAILADGTGRHQFLVGAYARAALVDALAGRDPLGLPVKELLAGLELAVLDDPRAARDCDTWEEVAEAEESIVEKMS